MKDFKVAGFPLPLYVLILALTAACMFTGCVPKSLVPAFLVLMVFGEGLNAIGNNVPVVKTYLGGSVICILGSAILTAGGLIPEQTLETLDYFVNDSGFLIFYIAALICGSLFNIDRNLLLRATVKLLPVAVISLSMGILLSGIMGIILGEGFWGGILYIGVPMTSGGMTAGSSFCHVLPGARRRSGGCADKDGTGHSAWKLCSDYFWRSFKQLRKKTPGDDRKWCIGE